MVQLKRRKALSDHEPQSEAEEVKGETDFANEVMKEVRKFMQALQNSKIVAQADLDGLKDLRSTQLKMVQGLGKFKGVLDGNFQLVIDDLNK